MKRWSTWLPMLIALPVILFLGWRFSTAPVDSTPVHVGSTMPEFSLPELYQNELVTDKTIKGEWALVNIWATWCSPCLKEHGVLMDIAQRVSMPIYGIDFKDDAEAAKQWLAEKGNPYTLVLVDDEGRSAFDWGVIGVPETLLIDPEGRVKHRFAGQLTAEIWETQFLPLLPQEPLPE